MNWTQKTSTGGEIQVVGSEIFKKGTYEPGNSTLYSAIVTRYCAGSCGNLGNVQDGWLVVSGNTCKAYLFQKDGYLDDDYIKKHLGGLDGDYPYFGDLVRTLLGRPGRDELVIPYSEMDHETETCYKKNFDHEQCKTRGPNEEACAKYTICHDRDMKEIIDQGGKCIKDTGQKCKCVDCAEDQAERANRRAMNQNVAEAEGNLPFCNSDYDPEPVFPEGSLQDTRPDLFDSRGRRRSDY